MNNYMGDTRYEKVWEQMQLLGIEDITTKRQEELIEKMKYITVLDFEVGEVYQYESPMRDFEEYLSGLGHNLNNCEWMVHENSEIITP